MRIEIEVGEKLRIRREGVFQGISAVKEVTEFTIVLENGQEFSRATGIEFSSNKLPRPCYLSSRVIKKPANLLRLVK